MSASETAIGFAPMIPWSLLAIFALLAVVILGFGLIRGSRGVSWRLLASATLLLTLVNPTLIVEERDYLPNVALVVLDESPSQSTGERKPRSEAALAHLKNSIEIMDGLELRVIRAGGANGNGSLRRGDGTNLFGGIERALADLPRSRVAGVVLITDGQVHDAPSEEEIQRETDYPVHVLLSGDRDEQDRRLILKQAPSYGIVGNTLTMTVRVEDVGDGDTKPVDRQARLSIRRDGEPWRTAFAPVGEDYDIAFTLEHAGPTFFEIETDAGPRELSLDNNRVVAAVNGVRDRLRVLLVSGEPHPGERTWRNLLKADPAVDLVHFTILRPPEKQDRTPVSELSLISFPVHELFDLKLNEFDLIIFDRYRRRGVLLNQYLDNIARYVEKGGALLVAVGPTFAKSFSLFNTPMGRVIPGRPTGRIMIEGYRPRVTETGNRHPVTSGLPGTAQDQTDPSWGRWFRQIDVETDRGSEVMSGIGGKPLLILDRVGEGRVAQLLSDHIWLWSRGYEGGGPQAELLRRAAHWLMKEPELEENDLRAEIRGSQIEIQRRSLEPDDRTVTVTAPSGESKELQLRDSGQGRSTASLGISESGVYRVSDGERTALVAAGALNPREIADLRTTGKLLQPIVNASQGSILWLADGTEPEVRPVASGRQMSGSARLGGQGWLGLRGDQDYVVTGVREISLLPALLVLFLGLGGLLLAWRREGQ